LEQRVASQVHLVVKNTTDSIIRGSTTRQIRQWRARRPYLAAWSASGRRA
jgi:hypothetical protein